MQFFLIVIFSTVISGSNPINTSHEMYENKQKQRRFKFADKHELSKYNRQSNSYDVLERNIGMFNN